MRWHLGFAVSLLALVLSSPNFFAGVGDPQLKTNHPWYPGELACSTFPRLFATQRAMHQRVVGRVPRTDEDKVLASWLWRNTHYWHCQQGVEDWWGRGFGRGGDTRPREYWTGLFAHGFGLCGTTHSQWVAEMEALLGHGRGRGVGVAGHVAFEVFLKGGTYGQGQWALLDHDLCTVIFAPDGKRLLGLDEIHKDWKRLTDRKFKPGRQRGWPVCGLHPQDGGSYRRYRVAEYLSGYAGVPPMVHLRRGETLRRYLQPGLEDGKTFVFWGRNDNVGGIPGPQRSRTWVNQPDKMYRSRTDAGYRPGQARYANAVYTYRPNFVNGDYREGVVQESDREVTFEFYTPYIIAATPPNNKTWGIYDPGCRNGLVLQGKARCPVSLSVDQGASWQACGALRAGLDLTDRVKGHRQYLLRLHANAKQLRGKGVTLTTVCQANASILPHLTDQGCEVTFQASGQAVLSVGPNLPQAQAHKVAGRFGSPRVTLEVSSPRKEPIQAIHAAAHVQSGSPPRKGVRYHIDYSDAGKTWKPIVKDWTIPRRGKEPGDFWSQSLCWGSIAFQKSHRGPVQVRFHNDGGRAYLRAEVHAIYEVTRKDATRVTFAWTDERGKHRASREFGGEGKQVWKVPTGKKVRTRWVEMTPVGR